MAESNTEESNTLQVISEQLDCSICANRLSDPKDLDCSHTFCCKCLTNYARSSKVTTVIACPLCRQNTVLPSGGITYLKTNYLLRDVIDAVPLEDARLPKPRANISDKGATRTCGVHNGVARDIYCATCNVLVCHKCIGTGHCSTGHCHYSLHSRANYARNYLKTLSSESADKLADLDSMQDEILKVEATLCENRQKTMDKIGEHVMKLTTSVLAQQSELIKEVDAKYVADVEALKREKERIVTLREHLQQYRDETIMTARNEDDETVVLLESKLDSEKSSHERQEFNLRFTEFEFKEYDVKFGSLTTKSLPVKARETVVTKLNWRKCKDIPGSGFNKGIAVSPCGLILAVCKSNEVRLFKTDSGLFVSSFQGTAPECLQSPQDLVFLNDGNLVVIDAASKYVRVFKQDGRFVNKFNTLEANEYRSLKVKLSCIGYDRQHEMIVIGDINRKVLTFHQNDGSILQTLYLTKIDPVAVDINVKAGLVAVTNLIFVHIASMTGKGLLVLERYGSTKWPLAANAACFDADAKSVFVTRSMPFGEKSILQYAIPSGKYLGCIYKELSSPTRLIFFKNNKLAVADGSSVKILTNIAESEI